LGLGFPGEVIDGVVRDGANLARPGGAATPVDDELAARWRGFPLERILTEATNCDVRVANDASMAALGCATGVGVELMVTLGTGCGLALVRDGVLVRVRDVGADVLVGSESYDALIGEQGRRRNEAEWLVHVVTAVTELASEFSATSIHLAGGNARRISPHAFGSWAESVIIERDEPALRGAWRACYP
jgi:polyphosphate glucokinase